MSKRIFHFSMRARHVILALRDALINSPQDLVIRNCDELMIERCEMLVREFPRFLRFGFIIGIHLFDRLSWLFGFGFQRSINMSIEKRKRYAEKWLHSPRPFWRDIITGLRGIIMLTYFSHKDIWQYIGYDPVAHTRDRIAVRDQILKS